jgi:hypothetical protein
VQRQAGTGCLAERKRGPAVVDVVMSQDHPAEVGSRTSMFGQASEDRSEATCVARVDDGQAVRTFVEIRLGAPNPGDARDQCNPLFLKEERLTKQKEAPPEEPAKPLAICELATNRVQPPRSEASEAK